MSKITDLLIAESEKYVSALLAEKLTEKSIFYNLSHVLRVRRDAETIGAASGFSNEEMDILRICALFYQAGYACSFEQPQQESVALAASFLSAQGLDPANIEQISGIIRSASIPESQKDKIAEVLCDAGLMFIAAEDGVEQFDLLIDETAMQKPNSRKRSAYEREWIEFLTTHTFYTEYGKTRLQPLKEATVMRLSERMKRRKLLEKKDPAEGKPFTYSRGVETMFRITARNQINLNSIADNKSNILISVNAIIISIIITMLAGNIGNMSQDIVPILIFLIICLITIIIAILSTRPNIITRRFTDEDLKQKRVDLIFFGNFVKMDYDDYLGSIRELMKDDEHLYDTLLRNQYSLGKILSKKFRLVRIAYNVFMIGIIITVVAFLVNYLLF